MESRSQLLARPPRVFDKDSTERIVYVAQREVGHCLRSQCDVLVSDRATTCHILAFQSSLYGNAPLTSLTHIDGPAYSSCVRAMIDEHIVHHQGDNEEEKKSEDGAFPENEKIDIQIHIVGGFDDEDSSSLKITAWLMGLLAQIAEEQQDLIKMTLKTCVVSSMNDDGRENPIGRGLGIDVRSGEVFLAKVEKEAAGPEVQLRTVRLFSRAASAREVSVICSTKSENLTITPFWYEPSERMNWLLTLPDDEMILYTSTSPFAEEPDFCNCIRSTFKFLRDVKCENVFGADVDKPLVYQRLGKLNSWQAAASS